MDFVVVRGNVGVTRSRLLADVVLHISRGHRSRHLADAKHRLNRLIEQRQSHRSHHGAGRKVRHLCIAQTFLVQHTLGQYIAWQQVA